MVTNTDSASMTAVKEYMLNYFKALETLQRAREKCYAEARDEQLSDSEQATAVAAYLDIANKIAHLKDVHDLILQKYTGTVSPPDEELIHESRRLSENLARQLTQANTAVAILGIITQFVGGWSSILDGKVAAPVAVGMPAPADAAAALMVERAVRATNLEFLGARHS